MKTDRFVYNTNVFKCGGFIPNCCFFQICIEFWLGNNVIYVWIMAFFLNA